MSDIITDSSMPQPNSNENSQSVHTQVNPNKSQNTIMRTAVCRNWKTTVIGLVLSFTGFVAFSPNTFKDKPFLVDICRYITSGGLAALGISAKDYNITGRNKDE